MTGKDSEPRLDSVSTRVLRALYSAAGPATVPELAGPQASVSTVTRAVTILRHAGLVTESGMRHGKGRPSMQLAPPPRCALIGIAVIGINKQPVKLMGVVTDITGRRSVAGGPTPVGLSVEQRTEPQRLIEAIASLARELSEKAGPDTAVIGLGVNIGGYVRDGVLRRFPGLVWESCDMQAELHRLTGLPARVDNDATALATHLSLHDDTVVQAGSQSTIAFVCVLGDGIGGALVVDGRVRRGSRGLAMEPGHLAVAVEPSQFRYISDLIGDRKCHCHAVGCVEAYAAPNRMLEALVRNGADAPVSLEAAAEDVPDGLSGEVFKVAGQALGRGIGNIVNTLDPDLVIVCAPKMLAQATPGSAAGAWSNALDAAVEHSDFAEPDESSVTERVHLRPYVGNEMDELLAIAAATLVTESLLDQAEGLDVAVPARIDWDRLRSLSAS